MTGFDVLKMWKPPMTICLPKTQSENSISIQNTDYKRAVDIKGKSGNPLRRERLSITNYNLPPNKAKRQWGKVEIKNKAANSSSKTTSLGYACHLHNTQLLSTQANCIRIVGK